MKQHPAIEIQAADDGHPVITYAVGAHTGTIELIPRSDATLAIWARGQGPDVAVINDRKLAQEAP